MSMIRVEDLTLSYPGSYDAIFSHVSFQMDTNWKLGLIGRNGRGKTTLLQLLLGRYEYSGTITSSVPFAYFPYSVPCPQRPAAQVLAELCPAAEEWEQLRELSYLEVDPEALERPFFTLSNGEQTKVQLAALFLNQGRFLLIDEPTNHLDTAGRALVSAYLKRKRGFLLVSHDRSFLDGCVDHILSLNRADIDVQSGNFSSWLVNFQRQQAFELAQSRRLQKEVSRLQQAAQRTTSWSDQVERSKYGGKNSGLKVDRGFVGHKSAKMMRRTKQTATRQQRALEERAQLLKNRETWSDLKLTPLAHHAQQLVTFSGLSLHYDGRAVCGPLDFTLRQGERVALEGKNGSGKSSILKAILGRPLDHTGRITLASGLVISYVPQDTDHLRGSLSAFAQAQHIEESLFKAILRKMGFARVQFEKDLADYSGGQKKQVLLAASLCEQAHLYIWDEPLNFIDLYTRMQIEALLVRCGPTLLFVEHDRAFQQAVATRTIQL